MPGETHHGDHHGVLNIGSSQIKSKYCANDYNLFVGSWGEKDKDNILVDLHERSFIRQTVHIVYYTSIRCEHGATLVPVPPPLSSLSPHNTLVLFSSVSGLYYSTLEGLGVSTHIWYD